ncbi:MAG TPA: DUF3109 family protein [Polyangiales bacterium]|jgi:hypothetical protein|nr:DUF3109 family protein [Polyangiales bacterium]
MLRIKGYDVADELFDRGYAAGAGPCACTAECCSRGAYVDVKERDLVLAHAELIRPQLDETQSQDASEWFETEIEADSDYPSGQRVGTKIVNGKCSMLDARNRCSLQVAATAAGLHKWALKPLYCYLFPIEVIANVVRFDPQGQGRRQCCSVAPEFEVPLFRACREELVHLLGEDGYAALEEHYCKEVEPRLGQAHGGLVQLRANV